jgi:hypothetical protein
MKTGILLSTWRITALAATAALLVSCKQPVAEAPPAPEPAPEPPPPVATPAPATPIAVAPTPVPDPLAPPGVFILLQKASITSDDGIVGLKPGTVLRQVSPGTYSVDGREVTLRDDQVTNNLRIAAQYTAADASAQAAIRQTRQQRAAAAQAAQATPTPTPAPASTARASSSSSSAKLGSGTGVADPEYGNRRNIKVDKSGRYYWRDSKGNIRYDL